MNRETSRMPLARGDEVKINRETYVIEELFSDSGVSSLMYTAKRKSDGLLYLIKEFYPENNGEFTRVGGAVTVNPEYSSSLGEGGAKKLAAKLEKMREEYTERQSDIGKYTDKNHGYFLEPLACDNGFFVFHFRDYKNVSDCFTDNDIYGKLHKTAKIISLLLSQIDIIHTHLESAHLDIKPENILIVKADEKILLPRIIDFDSMTRFDTPREQYRFHSTEEYYDRNDLLDYFDSDDIDERRHGLIKADLCAISKVMFGYITDGKKFSVRTYLDDINALIPDDGVYSGVVNMLVKEIINRSMGFSQTGDFRNCGEMQAMLDGVFCDITRSEKKSEVCNIAALKTVVIKALKSEDPAKYYTNGKYIFCKNG